jgi:hypothetical protein
LEKHSSNISEKKYNEMLNAIKRSVKQISLSLGKQFSPELKFYHLLIQLLSQNDLLSETLNKIKHTLQEFEQNEIKYRKLVGGFHYTLENLLLRKHQF